MVSCKREAYDADTLLSLGNLSDLSYYLGMDGHEIQIQAHTNQDGIVHLDIPTGIADSDVSIKISFMPANSASPRVPGIDEGRFTVPADFNDPLPPDVLEAFEGRK